MRELIIFSLKRRFFNKANLLFMGLLLAISLVIFNLDKLMLLIQPDFNNPLEIKCRDIDFKYYLNKQNFEIVIVESSDIELKIEEEEYKVISKYNLSSYENALIVKMIDRYHQEEVVNKLDTSLVEYYQGQLIANINFEVKNTVANNDNTALAFMVVTSIYFMMISFSSMSAGEVVYEKTTKLLEIILTCVPVSAHFYGKLLVGWLTIIIQTVLSATIVGSVFIWRLLLDKGEALCQTFYKLGLIDGGFKNLLDIKNIVSLNSAFVLKMIVIFIILMLGIVSVQIIMVSISSFVSNVEEAGNIQSPIYILFMALYYFSLSFSQPAQLESGIGQIFSFLPVTSMLFMPYRLMLTKVGALDILLCLIINVVFMIGCLFGGYYLYQRGILYNSSSSNYKVSNYFTKVIEYFNNNKEKAASSSWYKQKIK